VRPLIYILAGLAILRSAARGLMTVLALTRGSFRWRALRPSRSRHVTKGDDPRFWWGIAIGCLTVAVYGAAAAYLIHEVV
jgi:hypothetical protein